MKTSTSEQADFQVAEIVEGAGQHEIERAQAENRKHVRGEDDEGLASSRRRWPGWNPGRRCRSVVSTITSTRASGRERLASLPDGHELLPVQVRA